MTKQPPHEPADEFEALHKRMKELIIKKVPAKKNTIDALRKREINEGVPYTPEIEKKEAELEELRAEYSEICSLMNQIDPKRTAKAVRELVDTQVQLKEGYLQDLADAKEIQDKYYGRMKGVSKK